MSIPFLGMSPPPRHDDFVVTDDCIFCGCYGTLYRKQGGNLIENKNLIDFLNQEFDAGRHVVLLHPVPESVSKDVSCLGLRRAIAESIRSTHSVCGVTLPLLIYNQKRSELRATRWLEVSLEQGNELALTPLTTHGGFTASAP